MLPAGAAHRDGEIAAIACLVFRYARLDEPRDVIDEPPGRLLGFEKPNDLEIPPRQLAKRGLPVRVRDRARVEHEVGITWDAVLETKGLECDRQPANVALLDALVDDLAQLVHAHA